jgi:hypothetical protein
MAPEAAFNAKATCPICGRQLHDEPVVVDHALHPGLVCPDHGVTSVEDPLTAALVEPLNPSD